jgi:predicted DNA-binding transcriptional regulator AlpA
MGRRRFTRQLAFDAVVSLVPSASATEYMGKSNIYRLMALGMFPRPIQLGGSKWVASEVEESIQLRKHERDRQHSRDGFAPRPDIFPGQGGAMNESISGIQPGTSASQLASTVRMLSPELCDALRMLKLDIPELVTGKRELCGSRPVVRKTTVRPSREGSKIFRVEESSALLGQFPHRACAGLAHAARSLFLTI